MAVLILSLPILISHICHHALCMVSDSLVPSPLTEAMCNVQRGGLESMCIFLGGCSVIRKHQSDYKCRIIMRYVVACEELNKSI